MPTLTRLWRHQEFRFLIVGAWNTVFGYGAFVALYWAISSYLHYGAIAVLAHLLAVTQSFITQRTLVFAAPAGWISQYFRFHITSIGALGFNLAALALLVEAVALPVLLAQAAATILSTIVSYLLHKHFSFRKPA